MIKQRYAKKGKLNYISNILNKSDYFLFSPKNLDNSYFDSTLFSSNKIKLSIINVNTKRLSLSLKKTPNAFFTKAIKTICFLCVPEKSNLEPANIISLVNSTQATLNFLGAKINNTFLSPASIKIAQNELQTKSIKSLLCQTNSEIINNLLVFNHMLKI